MSTINYLSLSVSAHAEHGVNAVRDTISGGRKLAAVIGAAFERPQSETASILQTMARDIARIQAAARKANDDDRAAATKNVEKAFRQALKRKCPAGLAVAVSFGQGTASVTLEAVETETAPQADATPGADDAPQADATPAPETVQSISPAAMLRAAIHAAHGALSPEDFDAALTAALAEVGYDLAPADATTAEAV